MQARLKKDVDAGIRTEDVVRTSIERIPLYEKLNTYKVDVSKMSPKQVADFIIQSCLWTKHKTVWRLLNCILGLRLSINRF